MTDYVENKIFSDKYDLFDRTLYGGVGHGVIIIPTNIFKVLFTVIFPPIGEIINELEEFILDEFPYITWDTLKKLFDFRTINKIIYSFLLTSLFYVPGLVYTLANLTIKSRGIRGSIVCNPETGICVDMEDVEEQEKEREKQKQKE